MAFDFNKFGSLLKDSLNEQFTPGNKISSQDKDGKSYGSLGKFVNQIDKTAERKYIESGFIRNVAPRTFENLMQEPTASIIVKKRFASSLSGNFRMDLADNTEKLFLRASKKLFQNKCDLIGHYEKLTKIEKIIKNKGAIDTYMLPILSSSLGAFASVGLLSEGTMRDLDTIRSIAAFSEGVDITTWLLKENALLPAVTGEGTGAFEITLASQITAKSSVNFGGGNASISFEDPYKLMTVTNADIDKAIADATSVIKNNVLVSFPMVESKRVMEDLQTSLNLQRRERQVPPIRIIVNEESILYNRVRAIIDEVGVEVIFNYDPGVLGINSSVEIDPGYLYSTDNIYGMNSLEAKTFKNLIKNTFTYINLKRTADSILIDEDYDGSEDLTYVREKMRLNFANKNIIQPMDSIHIFMSTKSLIDPKLTGFKRNERGHSIASSISNAIGQISGILDDFNALLGKKDIYADVEKTAIVGADFPTWMWQYLKNDFMNQDAGIQTFSGVVIKSDSNYSAGKYIVNINANDNTHYLNMGQINFNPSVSTYNSAIYDPLTPFKLDFDASSGFLRNQVPPLLDENQKLLQSGLVKFKSGRFRGIPASLEIYELQNGEAQRSTSTTDFRKVFNDPAGLVYRWKSGIGSLTNLGQPHPISSLEENNRAPSLTKDPFAGQDVMNVLSLLITGLPYNYNNFINSAIESGNLSRDDLTNEDGSVGYFRGLLSDLTKDNAIWGNFIPFKKLILNDAGFNYLIKGRASLTDKTKKLASLLEERARLSDTLFSNMGIGEAPGTDAEGLPISGDLTFVSQINTAQEEIGARLTTLNNEIATLETEAMELYNNPNLGDGSIKIFGDNIEYDPTVSNVSSQISEGAQARAKNNFREKLNILTQRRAWKVRANEDQNLFIVDDQYDANLDIQSFEKSLSGAMQLFNSEYQNSGSKINTVAKLLGLEVFADSQGHIIARPPGYNKVPSSVFFNMLRDNNRVFPRILENLFLNKTNGVVDRLEIVEDQIRLRAIALGFTGDYEITNLINSSRMSISGNANFHFLSDTNGKITTGLTSASYQANPDIKEGFETKPLKETILSLRNQISVQNQLNNIFDIRTRSGLLNRQSTSTISKTIFNFNQNDSARDTRFDEVRTRLSREKGIQAPTMEDLFGSNLIRALKVQESQILKVLNDIGVFVAERQGLIKVLAGTLKNLSDGLGINEPATAKSFLMPSIAFKKPVIPDVIAHMIENEEVDDFGEGSGKRYIIKDYQIINMSISETPPEYTAVEITGSFAQGLAGVPQNLATSGGGNFITSAFAVDYDLWRMYGFKAGSRVEVPALSNPDTQLAPFAVYLLNMQRKNILQGSITIAGNEYMQPGEVVYIESQDLLFYVEDVSHSFSFGGSYNTTLSLKYGRNPGEYIPTMLDIVGKSLYSNRFQANLGRHERTGNADGNISLGAICVSERSKNSSNVDEALLSGAFGDYNRGLLYNCLLALTGALTPGINKIPTVQVRIYSDEAGIADSQLLNIAAIIGAPGGWLSDPKKYLKATEREVPIGEFGPGKVDPKNVSVEIIKTDDPRSPSPSAFNAARANLENGSVTGDISEVIRGNIIDMWIVMKDVPETVATSPSPPGNSEAAQENQAKLEE